MPVRPLPVLLLPTVLLASAAAQAEPAAPPPPPPPTIRVETPPPPPAVPRTFHMHDGFYLRLSLGAGYTSTAVSGYSGASTDATASGAGGAFDVLIGGTPAAGLTIGGGLLANSVANPSYSASGQSTNLDRSMGFVLVGPFIDGFIDPRKGFHVGGMLGGAGLVFGSGSARDSTTSYNGAGMALWLGYDAWIAADWSLGGMLRFSGARVSTTESGLTETATPRNISLLFTALYH